MKKMCFLLILFLLVSLCACSGAGKKDPLVFYYPWADLEAAMQQDPHCTAMGSEERNISGNRNSLRYVLTLYFRGPLDPDLRSPFPTGTAALEVLREEDSLLVTLSTAFGKLQDMDLTLACTCLARTLFDMTDAQVITIQTLGPDDTAELSVTITRDNVLLEDSVPTTEPTE